MISTHTSLPPVTSLRPVGQAPTTTPAVSAAARVIDFFHSRHNSQHTDAPAWQRIEYLLRQTQTKDQPSLAEQIDQRVKNSADPLTDPILRNEVAQLLNQSSALNSQKTYAELVQDILDNPLPRTQRPHEVPSRSRRDLQNPGSSPDPRSASIGRFADALVEHADRQLAINVGNALIRLRLSYLDPDIRRGDDDDKVAITPDSTFSQAWAELADALHAEPFKSFAEARKIDISQVSVGPRGRLTEYRNGREFPYHQRDADWAAASATVLAAARKLTGTDDDRIWFYDREHASAYNVAAFYGVALVRVGTDDTLFMARQLLSKETFPALVSDDPIYATQYAPIKQRQRAAKQQLAQLPPHALNQRIERFASGTAAAKVQEADRELARLCSAALIQGFWPDLHAIPEYSTFGQARKNLAAALNGAAVTTFVQDNNVDRSSMRIDPVTGTLIAKVNGVDTTFLRNDLSGWDDAWVEVQHAVRQWAGGSNSLVDFPSTAPESLHSVMSFYNEYLPLSPPEADRQRKQHLACLRSSTELARNDGFKALTRPQADDAHSTSVKKTQQAIILQLAEQPLTLSPLETLANAAGESMNDAEPFEDRQANIEASAESALAAATLRAMRELKSNPTQELPQRVGPIPADSLFGQWRSILSKAINGTGFTEWAKTHQVDLSSLRYDPISDALTGKVRGVDQRFTAADFAAKYPDYFDVLKPVLTAARIFANDRPITLAQPTSSSAPLEWVCNFYNISAQSGTQAFESSMSLLERTKRFPDSPRHPERIESSLSQQKTALGNSNDRYALINQLKNGNIDNDDDTRFIVDQDSSHRPKGVTTVQKFLADQGWYEAKSAAQTDNLLQALQTPLPQAPALGNRWGFLSTDLPLSPAQRDKMNAVVKNTIGPNTHLLDYLSTQVPNLDTSSPSRALDRLLSSNGALELATNLQTEMKGVATVTSLKQWLLSALVLDLDPAAGTSRNRLAGFDLMQSDNWGLGADKIREQFTQHLTDKQKIPATLAPVAARLLMSGAAPYLLVNDVPSTVTMGSPEWVSFTTAVNRIELSAPGAAADMTFQQVMKLHRIAPINEREAQLQSFAQMNPVMDWAIVNNHVMRNDKDEYSLEQLASSQQKLKSHIKDVSEAKHYLTFESPNRRKMALKALREKWGTDINYERPYLTEKLGPGGIFSGIRASIVDVYEAGRLGESWRWEESRGPNFDTLSAQASELPDINEQFDKAFKDDFSLRRTHTISLFKNMLSQLPLEDRKSINNGNVGIFQVKGAHDGIALIVNNYPQQRAFVIDPGEGKIVRAPDLERAVINGQTKTLTIETSSQPGIKSEATLTRIDQDALVDPANRDHGRRRLYEESGAHTPLNYDSVRTQHLAEVLVDSIYLNKASFKASQRGLSNAVEHGLEPSDYFQKGLRFLPGGSSIVDIYHGQYAEAVKDLAIDIVIYAATEGAGKLWKVAKTGLAWTAAKASAKFTEKFAVEEGADIALKDVTTATTLKSLSAVSRMQSSPLGEQLGDELVVGADKANGVVIRSGSTPQIKLTAVHQDGSWYAYDAKTQAAYGPALEGFISDTSSAVRQETFSDGTQALVTQRPLAADAYTLPRTHGFDLVNEGKVYRYDARNPGVLTDLESADHFKPLEGFEAVCPAPAIGAARVRRGANDTCFSRIIAPVKGDMRQELQALEHQRLFPSEPNPLSKDQFVIFERRRYKIVDGEMGAELIPEPQGEPIAYKSRISATLKDEPNFGFFQAKGGEWLAQETQVVKLDAISDACNDKRELRGVIVKDGADNILVIEADTAEFYYTKLSTPPTTALTFNKCTLNELPLVKKYRNKLSIRQGASKIPLDANLISLPKLDTAFKELELAGYLKEDVDALKATCKAFTEEQQREVVYQLQRSNAIGEANIALRPNRVSQLVLPDGFATWTQGRQNEFYARRAKDSVNHALTATGLGPSNQIRSAADIARSDAAYTTIAWLRETVPTDALNRANLILKSGAGNCGEMALLSKDIIEKSGGRAYQWGASVDHSFTVVGGPSVKPPRTINFSGAEWADAWIVDPWADIACPAREYTQKFVEVMRQWELDNMQIMMGTGPISPMDSDWVNGFTTKSKSPL